MADPYGQPPYGQPSYGQPPYGQQPMNGQPYYGQPHYGQPPQMPMPGQYYQAPGLPPKQQSSNVEIDISKVSSSQQLIGNNDFQKSKIEFNESPKYQDVWATFLYLLTLIGTIALAYMHS